MTFVGFFNFSFTLFSRKYSKMFLTFTPERNSLSLSSYPVCGYYPPEGDHGTGGRAVRRGDGGAGSEPDGFGLPAGL